MINKIGPFVNKYYLQSRINSLSPSFPRLVSFPRTGSHWLRIMLELYTSQPLLPRSFYSHIKTNYLLCHTHDMSLKGQYSNVIYLYRNPPDVVYSQLNYYEQSFTDINLINFWSHQYSSHLYHWHNEKFTNEKIIISYEDLKTDLTSTMEILCQHLKLNYDKKKIELIAKRTTKELVNGKTKHDLNVINERKDYDQNRKLFHDKFAEHIMKIVQSNNSIF